MKPTVRSRLTEDRLVTPDGELLLRRLLGEGASARVYLAQRDDPELPMAVAVKILRRRRGAEQRLRRERAVLSRLDHPHVARLLGGGETEDGQGFLVLEYVPGRPVDAYCRDRDLGVDKRLALVLDVCAAVEHGHRALVLHRDLKPSNVLVTDDGVVKVVDFGIADLYRRDAADDLTPSADGTAFSPGFAAPEQVAGRPLTTAADVYSLGALLHLLLLGRPPYETDGASAAELERRLQEPLPALAQGTVGGALPRDLVAILQKALAPDTEQRYPSVAALAEDLRRFGAGLPVDARAPTTAYRVRKWLGRHRRGAAWAAAGLVVLLSLTVLLWIVSKRLTEQRDRARSKVLQAAATFDFLADTLSRADGSGQDVRQLLLAAEQDLPGGPAKDAAAARQFWILGRAMHGFGDPARAADLLRRALGGLEASRAESTSDGDLPLEALAHLDLVSALIDLDRYDEAESELQVGRRLARQIPSDEIPSSESMLVIADSLLGSLLYRRGEVEAADRVLRPILPRLSEVWPAGSGQRMETERIWALAQLDLGRYDEALPIFRAHLDHARQRNVPALRRLQALQHLGTGLFLAGRFAEADGALAQAVSLLDTVGEDGLYGGPLTAIAALAAVELGDQGRAAALARRSFDIRRRLFNDESRHLGFAWNVKGRVELAQGHLDEAEISFRRAAEILRRALPEDHPFQAAPMSGLGNLWVDTGRAAEAEPLLRRVVELRDTGFGPDNHETAQGRLDLAVCLGRLGRHDEALRLWQDGERVLLPTRRRDLALRRVCAEHPDAELCGRLATGPG